MGRKEYKIPDVPHNEVNEFIVTYGGGMSNDAYLFVRRSLEGINPNSFKNLAVIMDISVNELSVIVGVSERTFRNYSRANKMLNPITSEHILKIAKLYQQGIEVFGSKLNFNKWLHRPSIAFEDDLPYELLKTPGGVGLVFDELQSIVFGDLA